MLADPLAIYSVYNRTAAQYATDWTTAIGFVRTGSDLKSSTYRYTISSTHWIDMFVGNQVGKRRRYTVRFTESELVADPINSELNAVKSSTAYFVVDRSVLGAGSSETAMLNMLAAILVAKSDASSTASSVLGGQT